MKEIVHFIYKHALSMIEPWDDTILAAMTVPELTSDGFKIAASSTHYLGMKEYRGTIFVLISGGRVNYSSMAHDQKAARSFYDKVVNDLLAT